ncbi:alpha/beta hydrolase [Pseudomonas cichorii]|uniref:alpha/beta hydrolase n=1 Tax=Pseudomonas cichorii TaxID=36746 RepID=UPI00191039E9|nr:alpha/beta hydrolase [Pseudomonas cichorii]GFM88001.1 alpha/beta hydrolase [Pseudomonas cichorii]
MQQLIRVTALAISLTLSGCASQQENLYSWAQAKDAEASVVETRTFALQIVTPRSLPKGGRLSIFIEGDGRAWATGSQPSLDPSPRQPDMARLALDPDHAGVYVARPCQFVMSKACVSEVWTDARFSRRVIEAFNDVIDRLKTRYNASSIELIGYSGGAAVALLIAEERDDISQIQTIAGNVDPHAWVALHQLSPLKGSLDPLENSLRLKKIAQRHFTGTTDTVVPPVLLTGFLARTRPDCSEVISLPGSHATLMEAVDGQMLSRPIQCQ